MNDMMQMGVGMWMGFLGVLVQLLILVALALGIVWLVRRSSGDPERPAGGGNDPALGALRERFARGEIDEEEFRVRRRTLTE